MSDNYENMKAKFRELPIHKMKYPQLTLSIYRILRDVVIERGGSHHEFPTVTTSYKVAMAMKIAEEQGYKRCREEWSLPTERSR